MSAAPSPSPRPSLSAQSPASSRTSLEIPGNSGNLPRPPNSRRNRAALRDYYGLRNLGDDAGREQPGSGKGAEGGQGRQQSVLNELDREGFEAGAFVKELLEKERLEEILKVERALVGEIRSLDGERKALVYDNYSKLIKATDTIKRMRSSMDPLTPATSTLAPAISHIAESAASLSRQLAGHLSSPKTAADTVKENERQTVRWVLDAPQRLSQMIAEGQRVNAEAEWREIEALLDRWRGVAGVQEVRDSCEKTLMSSEPESKG